MTIIGIDPGLTGAVAILCNGVLAIFDTPTECIKKGKSNKQEFLPAEMASIFSAVRGQECCCFIEKVGAMPGQGVSSMFGFGKGYGMWIGILAALRIPYTLVTPQAWKKALMQGLSDKDASRGRAQQLFPEYSEFFKLKKHNGRADAALIAEHGRRLSNSEAVLKRERG